MAVVRASTSKIWFLLVLLCCSTAPEFSAAQNIEKEKLLYLRSVARGFNSLDDFAWSQNWTCPQEAQSVYCREINSCEQAYFLLLKCGASKRDCDSDGVPCEAKLCGAVDDDPCIVVQGEGSSCTCLRKEGFFAD